MDEVLASYIFVKLSRTATHKAHICTLDWKYKCGLREVHNKYSAGLFKSTTYRGLLTKQFHYFHLSVTCDPDIGLCQICQHNLKHNRQV